MGASCASFRSQVVDGHTLQGQHSTCLFDCPQSCTVALLCPWVNTQKAGELAPTLLMQGAKVASCFVLVSVFMWFLLCESLNSSTSYYGSLGKAISHVWNHFCFVKWKQQCVYMFILCVYFPWRWRFVLTQCLRWFPKYNINKNKVYALDFLSSKIWDPK